MYPQEEQFVVALCDMQQQPVVSPSPWLGLAQTPWEWDACAGLHPH